MYLYRRAFATQEQNRSMVGVDVKLLSISQPSFVNSGRGWTFSDLDIKDKKESAGL